MKRTTISCATAFWGRVMFPVHTLSGQSGLPSADVCSARRTRNLPKYVNSPESEIYHKSNELYGIYFAKQAIVKAGPLLPCGRIYGRYINAPVGSRECGGLVRYFSLTPGQIRLIHRFTNNITVLYDGDMAGIKASIRGIDMLLEEGMNIKVCLLPDGDDPDSFARKHNATEFQNFIQEHETDFIR